MLHDPKTVITDQKWSWPSNARANSSSTYHTTRLSQLYLCLLTRVYPRARFKRYIMEVPSTAHQGIVQNKRILKCITVGYRTGPILGRCLVLQPSTSSSHPLLHHLMQLLLLLLLLLPSSPLPPQSTAEVMSWRWRPAQSLFSKVKVNLVSKQVLRCSITTRIPLMYIILH